MKQQLLDPTSIQGCHSFIVESKEIDSWIAAKKIESHTIKVSIYNLAPQEGMLVWQVFGKLYAAELEQPSSINFYYDIYEVYIFAYDDGIFSIIALLF